MFNNSMLYLKIKNMIFFIFLYYIYLFFTNIPKLTFQIIFIIKKKKNLIECI